MQSSIRELEEKLFHAELINKLLEAENVELKSVIAEVKMIPTNTSKKTFRYKLKNTFLYRTLRKIKHLIVRNDL